MFQVSLVSAASDDTGNHIMDEIAFVTLQTKTLFFQEITVKKNNKAVGFKGKEPIKESLKKKERIR